MHEIFGRRCAIRCFFGSERRFHTPRRFQVLETEIFREIFADLSTSVFRRRRITRRLRSLDELAKPFETVFIDLCPLLRRESNRSLDKPLLVWKPWAAAGVFCLFHALILPMKLNHKNFLPTSSY